MQQQIHRNFQQTPKQLGLCLGVVRGGKPYSALLIWQGSSTAFGPTVCLSVYSYIVITIRSNEWLNLGILTAKICSTTDLYKIWRRKDVYHYKTSAYTSTDEYPNYKRDRLPSSRDGGKGRSNPINDTRKSGFSCAPMHFIMLLQEP